MSHPQRPRSDLQPVMARSALLDATMSSGEALQAILFEALGQVSANLPVVVTARSGEALHQLRVGLRRLRSALRLSEAPELADIEAEAKRFLNLAGPPRELDVFLDELFFPAVAELGAQQGFDILRERAQRARDTAWQSVIAHLSSAEFRRFEEQAAAIAKSAALAGDTPIGVLAPQLLDQGLKRAKTRGRHFGALAPPERHRLRIALKRLRYTAEFFAPLYPEAKQRPWLKPLKELQDMLGHLNDVAEVRLILGRLMLEEAQSATLQADLSYAAGQLRGFHQARASLFAVKTHKRWKSFRKAEPFWI